MLITLCLMLSVPTIMELSFLLNLLDNYFYTRSKVNCITRLQTDKHISLKPNREDRKEMAVHSPCAHPCFKKQIQR